MLAMTLPPALDTSQGNYAAARAESEPSWDQRLKSASVKVLQAREHVFFEGDAKHHVYLLEKGTVCLYKTLPDGRRQIVDFAYPGDLIGLSAGEDHVFSAQAITLTRVRCLQANSLHEAARHDARIGMHLYRALSDQLMAARDLLLTVGQRNATERLAALLVALSRRNERADADPSQIMLPMTRADIADFLSLTIETVSRTFTKLRVSGIIELAHSSLVIVREPALLEQLAAGELQGFK